MSIEDLKEWRLQMSNSTGFYKPSLNVIYNGKKEEYTKIKFDSFGYGLLVEIDFPEETSLVKGSVISGVFNIDNIDTPLFTTKIKEVRQNKRHIVARELFYEEMKTSIAAISWRKAGVKDILQDMFSQAGIDTNLDFCPDITLSRFSMPATTPRSIIIALINSIYAVSGVVCNYHPMTNGAIQFGVVSDIKHKLDQTVSLTSGNNILSLKNKVIKSFAYPVLANQDILIDGDKAVAKRSIIAIKPGQYRLTLEIE